VCARHARGLGVAVLCLSPVWGRAEMAGHASALSHDGRGPYASEASATHSPLSPDEYRRRGKESSGGTWDVWGEGRKQWPVWREEGRECGQSGPPLEPPWGSSCVGAGANSLPEFAGGLGPQS